MPAPNVRVTGIHTTTPPPNVQVTGMHTTKPAPNAQVTGMHTTPVPNVRVTGMHTTPAEVLVCRYFWGQNRNLMNARQAPSEIHPSLPTSMPATQCILHTDF